MGQVEKTGSATERPSSGEGAVCEAVTFSTGSLAVIVETTDGRAVDLIVASSCRIRLERSFPATE